MISFSILSADSLGELSDRLAGLGEDPDLTAGILESFLEIAEEGAEVAVCGEAGCLLVRIYDGGRYSFVYPIELGAETDPDAALRALADYSVREMIPFYLTDTPREELPRISRLFSHVDARAYDDDEDSFVALVYSECDMLGEPPCIELDGITLSHMTSRDEKDYAALCRSEEVNRYWGYDYREDESEAEDGYFLSVAESEFARGVAISLAIREGGIEGRMLGEAVLFDFDYRAGATVALRLLPEHQGRGLGSRTLAALISLAREIGLKRLRAEVMAQNLPSLAMTEKYMRRVGEEGGRVRFLLPIE